MDFEFRIEYDFFMEPINLEKMFVELLRLWKTNI